MKGNDSIISTLNELLEPILADEETHIDWLEIQLDQIRQMGPQSYLAGQIRVD